MSLVHFNRRWHFFFVFCFFDDVNLGDLIDTVVLLLLSLYFFILFFFLIDPLPRLELELLFLFLFIFALPVARPLPVMILDAISPTDCIPLFFRVPFNFSPLRMSPATFLANCLDAGKTKLFKIGRILVPNLENRSPINPSPYAREGVNFLLLNMFMSARPFPNLSWVF